MIVAFEGMDGVGKSTVASKFAEKNNFFHETQKITRLLGVDDQTFRSFVHKIRNSDNKQLSAMFYIFRCMLDNEDQSVNSVVERTIASLYYFEKDNMSEEFWNQVIPLGTVPRLIFLLYASPETRFERIKGRNANDPDLKSIEAFKDGYKDMIAFYKKYNIPYIGINTEGLNLDGVVNLCTDIYKRYIALESVEEKYEFIKDTNKIYGVDKKYITNPIYKLENKENYEE